MYLQSTKDILKISLTFSVPQDNHRVQLGDDNKPDAIVTEATVPI